MSEILILAEDPYYKNMTQKEVNAHPQKTHIEKLIYIADEYADIISIRDNGHYEIPSLGLNIGTGRGWNRNKFILIRTKISVSNNKITSISSDGKRIDKLKQYKVDLAKLTINTSLVHVSDTDIQERTIVIDELTDDYFIDKNTLSAIEVKRV